MKSSIKDEKRHFKRPRSKNYSNEDNYQGSASNRNLCSVSMMFEIGISILTHFLLLTRSRPCSDNWFLRLLLSNGMVLGGGVQAVAIRTMSMKTTVWGGETISWKQITFKSMQRHHVCHGLPLSGLCYQRKTTLFYLSQNFFSVICSQD